MNKYDLELTDENIKNSLINNMVDNKDYIESLIRLLSEIKNNSVICVDGDWGSGKSFLVKQLEYILTQIKVMAKEETKIIEGVIDKANALEENNIVFYYNAWANDDHRDPLQSIIFSILNEYNKYKDNVINNLNSQETKKELGKLLSSILSQVFLKIDINSDYLDKIKTYEDLANDVNSFEERKINFRILLDEILEEKRMILIIDELDRCNPLFATKLLEVVKHFYDYEKITIIVVANNNQLQHTIKQQYGLEFDSYAYLNKFYDYIMTIDSGRSVEYAKKHLNLPHGTFISKEVFIAMIKKYNMTIRECNKFKTLYDMAIDLIEGEKRKSMFFSENELNILYSIILPIIYVYKIKDVKAYTECINNNTVLLKETIEYLDQYFNKNEFGEWLAEFTGHKDPTTYKVLVISTICDTFNKMMSKNEYNKVFLNAIRSSL